MNIKKEKTCSASNAFELHISHLSKAFDAEQVLHDVNLSFSSGNAYCLMAPSGSGKTTLFRILMGLETPDSGEIHGLNGKRIAPVFQEDRLLEGFTALQNLRFVTGRQYSSVALTEVLARLLPQDALHKPVREFSGGMKRRVSILRALLAPSDILIMDEPFTGLDAATKETTAALIREYSREKLVLFSTHHTEDIELLSAIKMPL